MNQKGFIRWIILVIMLIAGAVFIYFKAADSLPGEIIYPIKEIRENLSLTSFIADYYKGAVIYTDLTKERFEEVLKLIDKKSSDDKIKTALDKLILSQKKTLQYIETGKSKGYKLNSNLDEFEKILFEERESLSRLLYQVPESLYDSMRNTIQTISENIDRTRVAKVRS
ncbi:hypothetical protein HYS94_05620 [Candidatus Daviesbacteria bacterium]|nr:hypothetical protein [Candidatus Daviesbacteria bacterium]